MSLLGLDFLSIKYAVDRRSRKCIFLGHLGHRSASAKAVKNILDGHAGLWTAWKSAAASRATRFIVRAVHHHSVCHCGPHTPGRQLGTPLGNALPAP